MQKLIFPSKVSSKCPAIIFAVKRTASVPGWIRLLIISMININGINIVSVSCGTKCSNMWLVFLIHPNNINLIHRGGAKVNVSAGVKNACRYRSYRHYRCAFMTRHLIRTKTTLRLTGEFFDL